MSNILDYLDWRGDLPFSAAPFNEIDNLIFTQLCFLDMTGIVSSALSDPAVRLEKAVESYFILHPPKTTSLGAVIPSDIHLLAQKAAAGRRFRDVCVTGYVNCVDNQEEKQFSATTYLLGDGTVYVAFRGTDDTLIGWKEDFNMAFKSEIPAQKDAAHYLNDVLHALPHPVRVGGHSKGGNLAIYAAVHADEALSGRICDVYSNDGPGFSSDLLRSPAYLALKSRVHSIVPESSIVGMLLNHEENYKVVKSSAKGLFQHDGFSWQLLGESFCTINDRSEESKHIDKTLKTWLATMDDAHREQFVDALYSVLAGTNAQTVSELNADRRAIFTSFFSMDPATRDFLWKTIVQLINTAKRVRKDRGDDTKGRGGMRQGGS